MEGRADGMAVGVPGVSQGDDRVAVGQGVGGGTVVTGKGYAGRVGPGVSLTAGGKVGSGVRVAPGAGIVVAGTG